MPPSPTEASFPLRFGDKIDFSQWAVVSYNDDTGLGRQANDMRQILGIGYHFVLPSLRLQTKLLVSKKEILLPSNAPPELIRTVLEKIQGILVLEKLEYHLPLVRAARDTGVLVVCVPNWEHFAGWKSLQREADLFLCPSGITQKALRFFGFGNSFQVPCPIALKNFPERTVSGPARRFIHNGGLPDSSDRKATWHVIEAFKRVPRPDISLSIRVQKVRDLPPLDPRIEVVVGNLETAGQLYLEGDVAIQPSKLEGIGFTVLEAAISGLPVITTNFPPMNEIVRDEELLCHASWKFPTVKPGKGAYYHSLLREPDIDDLARRIQFCAENDMSPFSQNNRRLRTEVFSPEKVRDLWQHTLQTFAYGRAAELNGQATTPIIQISSLFFSGLRVVSARRQEMREE